MMENHDHLFTPEQVDEQIERQRISGSRATPEARFLAEMQQVAWQIRGEHERSLRRVEDRLMKYSLTRAERPAANPPGWQPRPSSPLAMQQGSFTRMENRDRSSKSRQSGLGRRLSLLIAAAVVVVLVGSLVLVMNAVQQKTPTDSPNNITATPTGTPASQSTFGKTLYTTPSSIANFNDLAFSPDSRRIASATTDGPILIWDATTGKHLLHIPQAQGGFALAWSPNGQFIAIAIAGGLSIANSQSGAIVHTYYPSLAFGMGISGDGSLLSAQIPNSGGIGVMAVAWSHDGRFIAASVRTGGMGGYIQVLNARTYAPAYTLSVKGGYGPGPLAWSSNGKYLAVSAFGMNPQAREIIAWNVATRQAVFEKAGSRLTNGSLVLRLGSAEAVSPLSLLSGGPGVGGFNASLAFQPGSDNLTFAVLQSSELENWNMATGKLVNTYNRSGTGLLAWSPDGRYLASVESPAARQVDIIDASTGQTIYTYTGNRQAINALAWSPNGKYIVSGEELGVANVWTAE